MIRQLLSVRTTLAIPLSATLPERLTHRKKEAARRLRSAGAGPDHRVGGLPTEWPGEAAWWLDTGYEILAFAMSVLLLIGIRNTWDMTIFTVIRGRE